MRITLTLDSDVHSEAKRLAKEQGRTMGEVLSEAARATLVEMKLLDPVPATK